MMLGPLTFSYLFFSPLFQQNLPEDPPVQYAEDTEGGGEDQEIQEEWEDALPELDSNPQDLGGNQGGTDTSDPLDQEELLDEESSEDDLEEDDSVKPSTEGADYLAAGLDSGTESDTLGNSSGEIYTPAKRHNQGKQTISVLQTLTVGPQAHLKGQPQRAHPVQAPLVHL